MMDKILKAAVDFIMYIIICGEIFYICMKIIGYL